MFFLDLKKKKEKKRHIYKFPVIRITAKHGTIATVSTDRITYAVKINAFLLSILLS